MTIKIIFQTLPSLEDIASGSVPYGMPSYPYGAPMGGPPMMYYPHGAYPPHPMGYPHPHPQAMPAYAGVPPAPTLSAEAAGLSTAYPLPVPKPSVPTDYSPVLPPRAAVKPPDKRKFVSSFQDAPVSFSKYFENSILCSNF